MGSQRKIRVAGVFGGRSGEHAVSCASAGLFLAAIDRDKYDVVPIGIARDGRWVLTSGDVSRLALTAGEVPSVEAGATPGVSVTPQAGPGGGSLVFSGPAAVPAGLGGVDVVLPLLQGPLGEEGPIRGLLEMAGVLEAAVRGARAADRAVRGGARPRLGAGRLRGRAQERAGRDRRARLAGGREARARRVVDGDVAGGRSR